MPENRAPIPPHLFRRHVAVTVCPIYFRDLARHDAPRCIIWVLAEAYRKLDESAGALPDMPPYCRAIDGG